MDTLRKSSTGMPFSRKRHKDWLKSISRLKIPVLAVLLFMAGAMHTYGQGVGISETTITPDAGSILELRSVERGFLVPRMTTAQRNSIDLSENPNGLVIYNLDQDKLNIYDASISSWRIIFSGTVGINDIFGTANRISIDKTDPANPSIDIAATYIGQSSITTLGTITTGIWNASTIAVQYGGTGLTTFGGTNTVLYTSTADNLTSVATSTAAGQFLQTTLAGGPPSWKTVLDVANGGTGLNSITANNLIYGNGTGPLNLLAPSATTGALLMNTAAGAPSWSTLNSLPSTAGVLQEQNGGTGYNDTYSNGELLIGDATGGLTRNTLTGTSNRVLVTNGDGTITLSAPQDIHAGASPTFLGLTLSGLSPNAGVYTDGSRLLTSTPPTTGTIGYWDRTGTVLSPVTDGDDITTSGDISTTGTGTITSAGLLTGQSGMSLSGGNVTIADEATITSIENNTINIGNASTDLITLNGLTNIGGGNFTVSSPQSDFNGNLDANNGLDVTGLLQADDDVILGNGTDDAVTVTGEISGATPLVFEGGGAADDITTSFAITGPTSDRTITFPDKSGTVVLSQAGSLGSDLAVHTDASGDLIVAEDGVDFNVNSDAINLGDGVGTEQVSVTGSLDVDGATTLNSTLDVSGLTTTTGIANTGDITNTGDINTTTIESTDLATLESLSVTNEATIGTTLDVGTDATVGGTLGVTDATTLGSTLDVTGATTLSNTLDVTGATTLTDLTATGDVILGDGTDDEVTVTGEISGAVPLVFEGGGAADDITTSFAITGPTADRTITFPDKSGTVVLSQAGSLASDLAVHTDGSGDLIVAEDGVDFNVNSDAINLGDGVGTEQVSVTGSLDVDGATTLNSTLDVVGATTTTGISNTGDIVNSADISTATIQSSGTATLNDASVTTTLDVGTDATVGGTLDVTGATTLDNTLDVTGAADLGSTLGVTGAVTLGSTLDVTGATTVTDLTATGDVILGDGTDDAVTVTGEISGAVPLVFEGGGAADDITTSFAITGPTADRTITFPDKSGTVVLSQAGSLGSDLAVHTDASGDLIVAEDGVDFNVNSDAINLGDGVGTEQVSVTGSLDVDGATTLNSTLDVSGLTTTTGIANTGDITNTGDINTTTIESTDLATLESLSVTNEATIGTTLDVGTDATVGGTLGVTDATTLGSTLDVTGATTLSNTLDVTGATTLTDLTATGDVILGDGTDDAVTVTGEISGATPLVFEGGGAADDITTSFAITGPTSDRTITFPDKSGTVVLSQAGSLGSDLAVHTDGSGDLIVAEDGVDFNVNSDAINLGDGVGTEQVSVTGSLDVDGATTLNSTLDVVGATTTTGISNTGDIVNSADISTATIQSSGTATLNDASVTTTLDVGTDATVGGTFDVTGATTLGNTLDVTGATDLGSTLGVTGAATLGSTLDVTGATTVTDLTATGDVILGNGTDDAVTVTGEISGATPLVFEGGGAADDITTSFAITGPTSDRTITFPDKSGTVVLSQAGSLGSDLAVHTDASGDLIVAEDGVDFNVNSDAINLGDGVGTEQVSVTGSLDVDGATTLNSTLDVVGATTTTGISNTGDIVNSADISTATIQSSGTATLNDASVTTTLDVGTDATVGGTLDVTGATTLGSLTSTGPVTLGDDNADVIGIQGVTAITGNSTDLSATVTNINSGDINLGDAPTDVLSVNGTIDTDLILDDGSALADGFETTVTVVTPTADNTIILPDRSGTVVLSGGGTLNNNLAVTTDASGQLTTAEGTQAFNVNSDAITLGVDNADALTVNAVADFTDDLNVDGGTTTTGITNTGDINTTTIESTDLATLESLSVTNEATVGTTLGVGGNVTLGDELTDAVSVSGTLAVTGASTLTGNTTVGGTLGVTGLTSLGDLTATGTSTLSTVDIGAGSIDGTTIGGTTPDAGSFTTIIAGTSVSTVDLTATGTVSLGNNAIQEAEISDGAVTSAKILDDEIVNADINSAAAIAGTKISPDFGAQNVSTTGTLSAGATTVTGDITVTGTVDSRDVLTDGNNQDDLQTLTGIVAGTDNLGTFTGSTITANTDIKTALQELELVAEAGADIDLTEAYTNGNDLVTSGGNNAIISGTESLEITTAGGLIANTVDIAAGEIDGTTIGGTTPDAGSFTTIIAGTSVSTVDLTATGTVSLGNNAIQEAEISDGAVTSAKILDDEIVNADINSAAAIAGTKISPDFGAQNVSTTGTLSAGATTVTGDITVTGTVDSRDVLTDGNNQDDLQTLTGIVAGTDNLGTFTGSTITANTDIKTALQELELVAEAGADIDLTEAYTNGNDLVTSGGNNAIISGTESLEITTAGGLIANTVDIAAGEIDGTTIGGTTPDAGSFTTIIAGTSVSTVDLTATGTVSLGNNAIQEAEISDGAVTSAKILDDEIVNADINSAAAIAGTKISPDFGAQNVSTTGTLSAGATTVTGDITVTGTVDSRDVLTDGNNQDDLQTLTGIVAGTDNLGTFTGSTITANTDIKTALQELELVAEAGADIDLTEAYTNGNDLVTSGGNNAIISGTESLEITTAGGLIANTVDIAAGEIDGTTIGGTTPDAGSFTTIIAGTSVSTVDLTATGTVSLGNNAIQEAEISDGAVTSAKILDDEIVNADINSAAAIAGTKISPDFGAQNVSTTGTLSAGATTVTGDITVTGTVDSRDVLTDGNNQDDLQTLTGIVAGTDNLGTFTGSTITANTDIKTALQELELVAEAGADIDLTEAYTNGNDLVTSGGNNAIISGTESLEITTAGGLIANTVDIAAGEIDGTTIGGTTPDAGSFTTIIAGTSVSTVDLTATGTVSLGNNAIQEAEISDGAVTSAKILDDEIVNADINSAAAIAGTKISPDFGAQNVSTTGTLSAGATTVTGDITVTGTVDSRDVLTDGNNQDDLQTLTGIAAGTDNLGTFTGSTITANTDIKTALQELELVAEAGADIDLTEAYTNGNDLVTSGGNNAIISGTESLEITTAGGLIANTVDIAAGEIDGTTIGGTTPDAGSFTTIIAGTSVSTVDLTATGTVSLGNNAIQEAEISDGAVTSAKILDDEIVNADINSAAAIAGTKISPDFGAQNVSTTGTLSAGATTVTGDITVTGTVDSRDVLTDGNNQDDLQTLTGIVAGTDNLGTFTGSTITANTDIKTALQELELVAEAGADIDLTEAYTNGNDLVTSGGNNAIISGTESLEITTAGGLIANTVDIAAGEIDGTTIGGTTPDAGSFTTIIAGTSVSTVDLTATGTVSLGNNAIQEAEISDGAVTSAKILDDEIVNADINSAAAIAGTKISPDFGAQNVSTTGTLSAGATTVTGDITVTGTVDSRDVLTDGNNQDDLQTLTGIAAGTDNLGTFTGSTITANTDIKTALQELELVAEAGADIDLTEAYTNGNDLVTSGGNNAIISGTESLEITTAGGLIANTVDIAAGEIDGTTIGGTTPDAGSFTTIIAGTSVSTVDLTATGTVSLGNNAIQEAEISDGAVTSAKILDDEIVNADINSAAAIAGTKISPDFGAQNVSTTGTLSAGATTVTGDITVTGTVDSRDVLTDGNNQDDLQTLTGIVAGTDNLGTFTGSTITANTDIKTALQELELVAEAGADIDLTEAYTNGNDLVTSGGNNAIISGTESLEITTAGGLIANTVDIAAGEIDGTTIGGTTPDAGSFTTIIAGTSVSTVDLTATGTVSLGNNAIQEAEISDGAVTSAKILDDEIVNADINSAAAIAGTKISPDFGAQNVSTTGTLSAGATTVTGDITVTGTVDSRDVLTDGNNQDDLQTLTGIAAGTDNLGTFTGSTITANTDIKTALQELELVAEAGADIDLTEAYTNGNDLVTSGGNNAIISGTESLEITTAGGLIANTVDIAAGEIDGTTIGGTTPDAGSFTTIIAGTSVSTVDLTATGTVSLGNNAIQEAEISDGAVTSAKILDDEIVNADINSAAAIAGTKISPDFGAQNVSTTGTLSAGATTVTGDITVTGTVDSRDVLTDGNNQDDLQTLTGIAAGTDNLGTFTGSTITANTDIKTALQELELVAEAGADIDLTEAYTNGNDLVTSGGNNAIISGTESLEITTAGGLIANTVDIAAGEIDGTTIGGTTPDAGSFTTIIAGTSVSTVDLTATGTVSLGNNAIQEAEISDGAVTSAKILDDEIVNADINSAAAIAGTKISPDFGAQNVSTTGTLSAGATTVTGDITVTGTVDSRDVLTDGNNQDDLQTLTGIAAGTDNLGTFTGSTITANTDIKTALQELELVAEAGADIDLTEAYTNGNDLVTSGGNNAIISGTESLEITTAGGLIANTVDIAAGEIDGTTIGGTTPDAGSFTTIIAGTSVSTVDLTATGTVSLGNNAIQEAEISDGAVTSAKILDDEIVNADINSAAAIAGTKISPDFGAQNVSTTGTLSAGATTVTGDITVTGTVDSRDVLTDGNNQDDLQTLTGIVAGTDNLGTFTGSTITANTDIKTALQELELVAEAGADIDLTEAYTNGNDLVTSGGNNAIISGTESLEITTAGGLIANTVDIAAGEIDGTTIGGTTPDAGSFTTIIAGTSVSTVDLTATGTVSLGNNAIQEAEISDGAVTSAKILDDEIVNADINSAAAIADSKLATISTAGKVSNSATTATNANTANAIVARDASGSFSAGTITANLTGNATTATNLSGGVAGGVPYQTASGSTSITSAGTSGQVLTSNGTGAPTWETPADATIPVSQSTSTGSVTTTSTSYTTTGLTVTPGAGDYLVFFNGSVENSSPNETVNFSIYQNGTQVAASEAVIDLGGAAKSSHVGMSAYISGLGAGQAVDVRWYTSGGTASLVGGKTLILQKVN